MPPANAIQKKRSFEPIDTYLHLLSGQTPTPENWDAAAELIHAGMATGHVRDQAKPLSKAQPEMDLAMRHLLHRLGQGGIAHYSLGCRKHKASADAYATTKERKQ